VRTLYTLASYFLLPYLLLHAVTRNGYRDRWGERFGFYRQRVPAGGIVLHAASVGEVNAALPLIRALRTRYASFPLTVTCFSPAGSRHIVNQLADEVHHVYIPLDFPGAVKRFLRRFSPRLLIIMETEIWPTLYHSAAQRGIPILMANARISSKSIKAYRRLRRLTRTALEQVTYIAAQSDADAARVRELGAPYERIAVTGNLKFELQLPADIHEQAMRLRQNWGDRRPVLLAASTHQGEIRPVLDAFLALLKSFPEALLVWAPREPKRCEAVAAAVQAAGLNLHPHSKGLPLPAGVQCLLVDVLGALLPYYAACDVAFVGGSLDPVGGHNVLEPGALSVPVLVGPHTFNFAAVTRQMLACGAAQRVNNAAELERATARLFRDAALRQKMGEAGLSMVRKGQGALSRTLQIVGEIWDQSSS